jgi:hypothetical protein
MPWFRFEKRSKAAIAAESKTPSTNSALPKYQEGCLQQIQTSVNRGQPVSLCFFFKENNIALTFLYFEGEFLTTIQDAISEIVLW